MTPVPAPGLREVAEIWWDVETDPQVVTRDGGATFLLVAAGTHEELVLARFATPVREPSVIAAVLAEGLAACDFPPTGTGAAPGRVAATLRAANRSERPVG